MDSMVGTRVLLLTIISVSAAQAFVKLNCTSENHGEYGKDSILKCDINPSNEAQDAKIMTVTWKKKGNSTALVKFDKSKPTNEPRFLVKDLDENTRDVSLIVSKTQYNDSGEYECMVITDSGADTSKITLNVTAKYSTPKVSSKEQDSSPTLVCNSEGGYPKGTIRWFSQGKSLTSSTPLEAKPMADGSFNLTSKLTPTASSQYTCSVYNANGHKEGETDIAFEHPSFTDTVIQTPEMEGKVPAANIVAPVVVIGSLIVGLLVLLLLRRRRSNGGANHTPNGQDEEKANLQGGEGAEAEGP